MPESQKKYYHHAEERGEDSCSHGIEMEMSSPSNTNEESVEVNEVLESHVNRAVNWSWYVNWALLIIKIYCYIISSSKAVAAAMADSVVDILSQMVLYMADRYINRHSKDYPVGRSRLEALSVLGCAGLMIVASIEVVQAACLDFIQGITGNIPQLENGILVYFIMGIGIVAKVVLYMYCSFANKDDSGRDKSDQLSALAEDHLNDVWSNSCAIVTLAIALHTPAWWADPVGAIAISVVIIYRWLDVMNEQVKKVVGHTAPESFIRSVYQLGTQHDERLVVDCIRAYHFGARYNVEMEIVLPGDMTVKLSHDIALELQHKIEKLVDVERAFVHVSTAYAVHVALLLLLLLHCTALLYVSP
jgi:cation diffusion facilitator family transporter